MSDTLNPKAALARVATQEQPQEPITHTPTTAQQNNDKIVPISDDVAKIRELKRVKKAIEGAPHHMAFGCTPVNW